MANFDNLANPRLVDAFGLEFRQDDVPFAIPHLKEDLPFYIDPYLMWASELPEDQALHNLILGFFGHIRELALAGKSGEAFTLLRTPVEPREIGLGYAAGSKKGRPPGPKVITDIVNSFQYVPQLAEGQLRHAEELQLVVPGFAEDGINDIVTSVLKQSLIDFTREQASRYEIPTRIFVVDNVYDPDRKLWRPAGRVALPFNPIDESPLLLAPLKFLRHLPWINYEDYYRSGYAPYVLGPSARTKRVAKPVVLRHNRENYTSVTRYINERESQKDQCQPDPLFQPLTLATLKKKFAILHALPTGKDGGADKRYEELAADLLTTLLYPSLEFAETQARTVDGVHIRDLIFYNDGKTEFWKDMRERHGALQPVLELKNVKSLETEHVNQLWRYLGTAEFGRIGVFVTRHPCPTAVSQNITNLHSSKRGVILTLDDTDLELMINMYEARRDPSDVLKKQYLAWTRRLPQ